MDWNLAIERNREALKRILAMLVAMAGIACLTSPLAGEDGSARRGKAEALAEPGEGSSRHPAPPSPPRDPAPAAPGRVRRAAAHHRYGAWARRDAAAGPPAQGEAAPDDPAQARRHRHPDAAGQPSSRRAPHARPAAARSARGPSAHRRPAQSGIPRISLPGVTAPFPVELRRPPAPDDPLDATRLALRLRALGAALDDLPRQARRFARWRAAREEKMQAALAASGRCVRAARPASALLSGAPTRCTRS